MPVILRLDGKAFHTLKKKCEKPFDSTLHHIFKLSTSDLCKEIQDAKYAYIQSDEVYA
jgi:tRNA(His) 5'-end guanylyltransferase